MPQLAAGCPRHCCCEPPTGFVMRPGLPYRRYLRARTHPHGCTQASSTRVRQDSVRRLAVNASEGATDAIAARVVNSRLVTALA